MPINSDPARQGFTKLDNNMFPGHDGISKLILWNLQTHAPDYIPTYRQIAEATGASLSTVKRRMKKLEDMGEIWRGEVGRNRSQKWFLNESSVVSERPHKWCHGDPTEKTKEKVLEKPKPKAKKSEALPDWEVPAPTPNRHSGSDIVFWAKELEPYFSTFINYRRLNDWLAMLTERHGPGAWKAVARHFDKLRIEKGNPDHRWPFSYRNLSILENQVQFAPKLRII